jgi:hypothetical protein
MTKKEHGDFAEHNISRGRMSSPDKRSKFNETSNKHKGIASKLSDKEHTDEEVGLGSKKEDSKKSEPAEERDVTKDNLKKELSQIIETTHNDSDEWRESLFELFKKYKGLAGYSRIDNFLRKSPSAYMGAGEAFRASVYMKARLGGKSKRDSKERMKSEWKKLTGNNYVDYVD